MGIPGLVKIKNYGIEFKLRAVQLSNQPGVLVKDVAESSRPQIPTGFSMRRVLLLVPMLALSACSNEPSQTELRQAVQGQYDTFNSQSAALGATSAASRFIVHDVKKIVCKKDAAPKAFSCDVEVDLTIPLIGRDKSVKSIRLVDEGQHWQVMNLI